MRRLDGTANTEQEKTEERGNDSGGATQTDGRDEEIQLYIKRSFGKTNTIPASAGLLPLVPEATPNKLKYFVGAFAQARDNDTAD